MRECVDLNASCRLWPVGGAILFGGRKDHEKNRADQSKLNDKRHFLCRLPVQNAAGLL